MKTKSYFNQPRYNNTANHTALHIVSGIAVNT